MAKTERVKGKTGKPKGSKHGAKHRINTMIEKYGDVVTMVRDMDRRPGSPSFFKPDYNRQVFWLALAGMSEYEMANLFGITDAGFAVWKQTRPDFLAALKAGRAEAVGVSAHSLYRLGNGIFTQQAEKLIPNRVKEYDPDTGKLVKEYVEVIHEPYTKQFPPNVNALLRFLAAKHPEVWGDRSEVVHSGGVTHTMDASKLSKKQLKALQSIAQSGVKVDKKAEKKRSKDEDTNKKHKDSKKKDK